MPLKPMVALDWSWVRALRSERLPEQFLYVVPEHILYEASSRSDPPAQTDKLRRVIATNRETFAVARHWNMMANDETQPGRCCDRRAIVHAMATPDDETGTEQAWQRALKDSADAVADFDRRKADFNRFDGSLVSALKRRATERQAGTFEDTNGVNSSTSSSSQRRFSTTSCLVMRSTTPQTGAQR
jgi:hypothetical protein